jgi:large subunit ribosomal protein L3
MRLGLIGRKIGMTRVFTEDGQSLPVTVVEVQPNRVTQVKTQKTDGYTAVQVTAGEKKRKKVIKPEVGHFSKAAVVAGKGLWEFRLQGDEELNQLADSAQLGSEIKVDLFKDIKYVDVSGCSKGRGFAGTIKRHNFAGQDASHGNSLSHRTPGSIGQCQSPGKVFKGKKMAGQMGNKRNTVQNLQVIRVDEEKSALLIKGAIPGAINGFLIIKPAVKKMPEQTR